MKKYIALFFIVALLAVLQLNAQAAEATKAGAAEFIQYLENNRASLPFETCTQAQKGDRTVVTVRCPLETQKKLLDVFEQFNVLEFRFEMAGADRVITTVTFPAAAEALAKAGRPSFLRGKLRIGAAGVYYYAMDKNIDGLYHRLLGGGLDLSYRFAAKTDLWLSAGYVGRSATADWTDETLKLTLYPFAGAIRYFVMEKTKWDVFLGAGVDFYLIREINPVEDIKTSALGFCALGGGYFKFSPNVSAQIIAKYNMISKDVYPDLDTDNKLDVGGLELRLGVVFSL